MSGSLFKAPPLYNLVEVDRYATLAIGQCLINTSKDGVSALWHEMR